MVAITDVQTGLEYGVIAGTAGGCHCRDLVPQCDITGITAYQNGYEVCVEAGTEPLAQVRCAAETVSVCGQSASVSNSIAASAG